MWGIVEKIIDDNIYVIFENRKCKVYKNINNLNIVENDQVEIINEQIINVNAYDENLYQKIKLLEDKIKNNN